VFVKFILGRGCRVGVTVASGLLLVHEFQLIFASLILGILNVTARVFINPDDSPSLF
jgi:hypothetical protein